MSEEKKESSNMGWVWLGLIAIGIFFGVGPFGKAKCSSDKPAIEQQQWDGSFTGRLKCLHKDNKDRYDCSCKGYVTAYAGSTGPCDNCKHAFVDHKR